MRISLRANDVLLVVSSLVLSLLLWLQVQSQGDRSPDRTFDVPLLLRGLGDDFMATHAPISVKVIASGTTQQLNEITKMTQFGVNKRPEVVAMIDLENAHEGSRKYPVRLNAPTGIAGSLELVRETERIQIERVTRTPKKVAVEERGLQPANLQYNGSTTEPTYVVVVGPDSQLSRIAKVRVMLDLTKIRPAETYQGRVEILDHNNQPLLQMRAEPDFVTVRPGLASAPVAKNVIVTPIWHGQPAFGFKVRSYTIEPSQISLGGNPAMLAKIGIIETEAVPLDGLKSSQVFTAKLSLPAGIESKTKSVRISIRLEANPAPASPSGGTGL